MFTKTYKCNHCGRLRISYDGASQLASESRKLDWVFYWCVWPDAVRETIHKLETINGGIIGPVGLQGVEKSSALLAIESERMLHQLEEYRKAHMSGELVPQSALDHF